ncbi:type IV pilin [Aeromonas simiae]|uniref:type IV pilin n=1 Tax=Aeromonas simiae TaxID=218936 RepID=UPI00299F5EBE|nr:type IV pilin [Aeromonas simiae]
MVELMVAMVAGLLLVAAVSALFASILRANQTSMQVSRLNQEMQSIVDMMARDLQRSGYDAGATAFLGATSSARSSFYFDSTTDLMNETVVGSKRYQCLRVRYDDDADGCVDDPGNLSKPPACRDPAETRVYSYSSASMGVRLDTGDSASCSGGNLLSTDNTIAISALTFELLGSSLTTGARTIRLSMTGNYKAAPAISLSLQRDIKLRNDGY